MTKINALQLIANRGIDHAKSILERAEGISEHGWYFFWCNDCGYGGSSEYMLTDDFNRDYIACPICYSSNLNTDDGLEDKLKNIIEAHDVIESLEGLKNAKFLIETYPDKKYLRGFSVDVIKNDIDLVEKVEKLKASK